MTATSPPSLWALADEVPPPAAGGPRCIGGGTPRRRRLHWVVNAVPPLALTLMLAVLVLLPASLPAPARTALFVFGLAVILWSTTAINAAYVALAAVVLLVLAGGASQEKLFAALASDVVWLMIGAFVLGAAVQGTGLAGRMTGLVTRRARTVGQMFWLVTTALWPLTFVIPSTSGRAAVALPVFRSLAAAAGGDARVVRALALLIPTVILVTTVGALTGAGSHLVANDLLERVAGRRVSFLQWILYGLPFAIAAGYLSCAVVLWMFLPAEVRGRPLAAVADDGEAARSLSRAEIATLLITAAMVLLWLTEPWHGVEIATVSVLGALALTVPFGGVITWKEGLKAVSWDLVVFVGAALVLGNALIETGAADWIIKRLFAVSGLTGGRSTLLVLLGLALISLTSHIYMTSHAARAAALVPPLLYLGQALELDPVAVMFIGTVGMDYCLTFPVSSKALLLFQGIDEETFQPADLLRLSALLLTLHAGLIVLFYFAYWRFVGLAL